MEFSIIGVNELRTGERKKQTICHLKYITFYCTLQSAARGYRTTRHH
jgi:hypothetical protein